MKYNSSRTIIILFLLLITIPYVFAQINEGTGFAFGGFLLNPTDGNSYLAKMNEGWNGSWQFTLPFSAEKGDGAYLFLFYIFLGHLSRLLGISLLLMYHLARIIGAVFMALCLFRFSTWIFDRSPRDIRRSLLLSLFGSGTGWLFVAFGIITSDLWVPEAFPFLAGFASPHFSFGIGLALLIFMMIAQPLGLGQWILLSGLGLLLSILMPFGIVVTGLVSLIWVGWEWGSTRKLYWQPLLAAFSLGGLSLLYQYWVTLNDPLLALWNAQNLTQSPPIWDLLASFFPAILLAVWAVWRIFRNGELNPQWRLLITWFIVGLAMIYFPFSLQRRFMFASFIPVSMLAVAGLRELPIFIMRVRKQAFSILLAASVLTNGVVILLAGFGILSHSSLLYITRDEAAAFGYLRDTAPLTSVVLCAPDTGTYIPGWTGLRVIYGHPFETVEANQMKDLVEHLYTSNISPQTASEILNQQHVNYIFWGPREKQLGMPTYLRTLQPVYQNETVQIFSW